MDGSQYNQMEAFIKTEIKQDSNKYNYSLQYVLTSQMYVGPASDAPEDLIVASGVIGTSHGVTNELLRFKNKYAGYLYLTVTRVMANSA